MTTPDHINATPLVSYLHKPAVIWKLVFLFDSLILFPLNREDDTGTSGLYPKLHIISDEYPENPKQMKNEVITITLEEFTKLMSKTPRGKAVGPYGDVTDVI